MSSADDVLLKAIRSANPASIVPISQRCTSNHFGRVARNDEMPPAVDGDHRIHADADRDLERAQHHQLQETLPCAGSMNCGSGAR